MLSRAAVVVFVACLVHTSHSFPTDDQCDVGDNDKVDCGHVGTDQGQCEQQGCCWHPENSNGAPWCYHKKGDITTCPLAYESKDAPFSDDEVSTMRKFFLANINIDGSGAVVAAPDYNTPGGSYYYHWERDGALSMGALLKTAGSIDEVKTQMEAYTNWVAKVQVASDPHGESVLTEPKYFIPNGTVYTGAWCRPQNDGPGLRATTLIAWADALKAANATTSTNGPDLWSLIHTDLDWAADNWQSNGCDLWEEIRSTDFFWNRFTIRAALTKGAAFAQAQGDSDRSNKYAAAAKAVGDTLEGHYDSGFVFESSSRKKDAAVICAFNDGYLGDGVFSASSKEVAGTISTLNTLFCNSFAVNQADTKAGVPGILYGRYEGDNYAGGNPWILLTAALAELLYRGAAEVQTTAAMDTAAYSTWAPVLGLDAAQFDATTTAKAMAGAADGVLVRLRTHVKAGGFHLNEQIDRNSGNPMAAKDLTWSYATMLKAVHARKQYYASL